MHVCVCVFCRWTACRPVMSTYFSDLSFITLGFKYLFHSGYFSNYYKHINIY